MSRKAKIAVEAVLHQAIGKEPGPYRRLRIDRIAPNTWNPNSMTQETREKLRHGIRLVLESVGHIPPIIVRRHPDSTVARWQIIDGQHRWDILRDEGHDKIDAYVVDVDDRTAMMLTSTLNYLRGEPDPDRFVEYYRRLLTESKMTPDQAAEYMPESADEITHMLDAYDIEIEHLQQVSDSGEDEKYVDENDANFIEAKFLLSRSQQEVVEAELARIGSLLHGKNIRGRALEYMAVISSQTVLENLTGELPEEVTIAEPESKKTRKRKAAA